jgi:hypothetical protein
MLASGCGGGATPPAAPRAEAAGKVTFDGQPIPSGIVTFQHEKLSTACTIENGSYVSAPGKGPAIGPNNVIVVGYDGPNGKPLWGGTWQTKVDVPAGKLEKDFAVAKNQVRKFDPRILSDDPGDLQ